MAEKRYYWLKLKKDFFETKIIKKLRRIAGGDTYCIIYLRMLLMSTDNDGVLFFDGIEDTLIDEIALELGESVENVQATIGILLSSGLIEMSEGEECKLLAYEEMTGSESASASRVRRHRTAIQPPPDRYNVTPDRYNVTACNGDVTACNGDVTACNETVTLEKEIEKELEIDIGQEPRAQRDISQNKNDVNTKTEKNTFRPPGVEEVAAYCLEQGYRVDQYRFVSYYANRGWTLSSGELMDDWHSVARSWHKRAAGKYVAPSAAHRYGKPRDETQRLFDDLAMQDFGQITDELVEGHHASG